MLGRLCLAGGRLELETISYPYLNRLMALIKKVAGPSVRWTESVSETSIEEMFESARRRKREPGASARGAPAIQVERDAPTIDVDPGVKRCYLDDRWRRWLSEPVPALGGRTPERAARLASQRDKVIGLLKEFENAEARHPALRSQPYDFTWLWRELGIDRSEA
jgi:hypothetical protein